MFKCEVFSRHASRSVRRREFPTRLCVWIQKLIENEVARLVRIREGNNYPDLCMGVKVDEITGEMPPVQNLEG